MQYTGFSNHGLLVIVYSPISPPRDEQPRVSISMNAAPPGFPMTGGLSDGTQDPDPVTIDRSTGSTRLVCLGPSVTVLQRHICVLIPTS